VPDFAVGDKVYARQYPKKGVEYGVVIEVRETPLLTGNVHIEVLVEFDRGGSFYYSQGTRKLRKIK
jgi:hypothetical protein